MAHDCKVARNIIQKQSYSTDWNTQSKMIVGHMSEKVLKGPKLLAGFFSGI